MFEYLEANAPVLMAVGTFLFALGGAALVHQALADRRAIRGRREAQHILAGLNLAPEVTPEPERDASGIAVRWRQWQTRTQPRYADVPTVARELVPVAGPEGRHLNPDEPEPLEEYAEEYVGKHRLPEVVTAGYLKAIMTQTSPLPVLRRLDPSWRTA